MARCDTEITIKVKVIAIGGGGPIRRKILVIIAKAFGIKLELVEEKESP